MAKKPWKKILYEIQDYADDYTDKDTFLKDLETESKYYVSLREAISGASLLLEELCTVVAFVLIYVYLYNEFTKPEFILKSSCLIGIFGYLVYRLAYTTTSKEILEHDFRTVLIFVVFGQLFSPVLHTLTDTISTDTIYTMTFFMMIVHLIFFDYGASAAIVSNCLSLSAAIFASICLASRLSSPFNAFILITVAIECFVLFPLLRKKVRSIFITFLLFALNFYFLSIISSLITFIFVLTAIFINFVCPVLFVSYQEKKQNIHGPWDEAIVDDTVIDKLK